MGAFCVGSVPTKKFFCCSCHAIKCFCLFFKTYKLKTGWNCFTSPEGVQLCLIFRIMSSILRSPHVFHALSSLFIHLVYHAFVLSSGWMDERQDYQFLHWPTEQSLPLQTLDFMPQFRRFSSGSESQSKQLIYEMVLNIW